MLKKIGLVLLLALVVIQFIHPKRNKSEAQQPNYIGNKFTVPDNVEIILAKACNDCHSNNTEYPWYARVQPVHWWLNNHIIDGKKHLNFDEYTHKSLRYQYHKMEETIEMVKENEMPLNSYTWIHKNAKLSDTEKSLLLSWAQSVMDTMRSQYPLDSLVRPK